VTHGEKAIAESRKEEVAVIAMHEDQELIVLVGHSDQAAFQHLYTLYFPRLWRYVWYQLEGNSSWTEEVLQDIFLAIWRAAPRFRGDAKVATWIFQIANHHVLNARRSRRHQTEERLTWANEDEETETGESSFEDMTINRLMLFEAIDTLSPKHQSVIYLVFIQGFSVEEVAEILEIPPNTVKSRIIHARRALLKQLGTPWLAGGGHHDA
jgi:RNA polymerase sigma-70 factor (ECF subfamily)